MSEIDDAALGDEQMDDVVFMAEAQAAGVTGNLAVVGTHVHPERLWYDSRWWTIGHIILNAESTPEKINDGLWDVMQQVPSKEELVAAFIAEFEDGGFQPNEAFAARCVDVFLRATAKATPPFPVPTVDEIRQQFQAIRDGEEQ